MMATLKQELPTPLSLEFKKNRDADSKMKLFKSRKPIPTEQSLGSGLRWVKHWEYKYQEELKYVVENNKNELEILEKQRHDDFLSMLRGYIVNQGFQGVSAIKGLIRIILMVLSNGIPLKKYGQETKYFKDYNWSSREWMKEVRRPTVDGALTSRGRRC
ncbi:hypothetical protein DM860_009634 [Cuscuta australis]|uniref:Uncharacterized protein n=1 Tax=Cuscuta australis TaxID=267555 RepID=A0A328DKH9_9ASTE|nr:hypothetical protein DM860_009634 [Cuscuta australis]